jgi:hypothetical protein
MTKPPCAGEPGRGRRGAVHRPAPVDIHRRRHNFNRDSCGASRARYLARAQDNHYLYGWSNSLPERLYPTDDFEADIRIYSAAEGGRRSPAFNGIRWDLAYANQQPGDTLYMIWPDFLDAEGNSRSDEAPLPVGETLPARMLVVVDEMREQVHRSRVAPGVRFYCHEGVKRVADGVVTRVTGLFEPRPLATTRPGITRRRREPRRQ